MEPRVVGWPGLLRMLGASEDHGDGAVVSKSNIEGQIRQGNFPKPRQFSDKRVGWLVSEVDEWIAARPASELPPPPNTGAKKTRRAGAAGPAVPA